MSRTLDKEETYLYGTILALVQKQLAALEKHQRGELGIWGRARANSRNGAIDKFAQKIIDLKIASESVDPIAEIVEDLEFIRRDSRDWDGISDPEVDMLRKLIAGP